MSWFNRKPTKEDMHKADVNTFNSLKIRAEQGDAEAQYLLGMAYTHGKGVPKDYAEALKWISCADSQGHPQARQIIDNGLVVQCGRFDFVIGGKGGQGI